MSYLAINLKKLRKAKRLNQTEFAKIFGLTRATVGAYEEGRAEPKLDKLIEIANYFGLSLDQLIAKKLSINEIFHYDQKISNLQGNIPYVQLQDKQAFLHSLKNNTDFKYKHINIPGLTADIAIETASFAGLKNCIVFGNKILKPKPNDWHLTVVKDDYLIFRGNSTDYDRHYLWKICCILTKDLDNLANADAKLIAIEQKLDLLINLQKQKQ